MKQFRSDWQLIINVPRSRSEKVQSFREKWKANLLTVEADANGIVKKEQYVADPSDSIAMYRDSFKISRIKNLQVLIRINGHLLPPSEGFLCFMLNYQGSKVFSDFIALFFQTLVWALLPWVQGYTNLRHLPILVCGRVNSVPRGTEGGVLVSVWAESGDTWEIRLDQMEQVVKFKAQILHTCPLFEAAEILTIIKRLPSKLPMTRNPYFLFQEIPSAPASRLRLQATLPLRTHETGAMVHKHVVYETSQNRNPQL